MNEMQEGLKEYRRKLKAGEIKALDPIEKSFANSNSLRLAINAKCFECSGLSKIEITKCGIVACALHRFRPYQKKDKPLWWDCKYCGENEKPKCHKCVREDGLNVTDELEK